jgi:hypothetical protein
MKVRPAKATPLTTTSAAATGQPPRPVAIAKVAAAITTRYVGMRASRPGARASADAGSAARTTWV